MNITNRTAKIAKVWSMPATRDKTNPLLPIVIEKKPTNVSQSCSICDANLEKDDLRVKIVMELGYRRQKNYYFHIHCFLDKLIAELRRQGYNVTEYVTGALFT